MIRLLAGILLLPLVAHAQVTIDLRALEALPQASGPPPTPVPTPRVLRTVPVGPGQHGGPAASADATGEFAGAIEATGHRGGNRVTHQPSAACDYGWTIDGCCNARLSFRCCFRLSLRLSLPWDCRVNAPRGAGGDFADCAACGDPADCAAGRRVTGTDPAARRPRVRTPCPTAGLRLGGHHRGTGALGSAPGVQTHRVGAQPGDECRDRRPCEEQPAE